ncbi:hypothetical protein EVAR_15034_1 [Eumeta japonica]|uniref:Uncharacterized protein n=1 Tax=Eumeta variegata TaxID=151549 RepID=A0A4C1X5J6_EUMVA|nr:hypothetical protein EVAR_15034_1 [Eumeta japonica]
MFHLSGHAHGAIYLHAQVSHPGLPFHLLSPEFQLRWHGKLLAGQKAAVFVTFTATRHLSSQSGSRSRILWSLAAARSARRVDAKYALSSTYSASTRCPPPSLGVDLRA